MYSYIQEFYPTFNRIFLLLCGLINNIMFFLGIDRKLEMPIENNIIALSPVEKYIQTKKNVFLQTFQEDESTDFNSNIDDVIRDTKALSEILANPDNEYEKTWKKRILIENTPRGNVFMFYDLYKRAFSYYCDQAVMPYEIMNAVAMKYVIMYRCRDFFIDSAVLPTSSLKLTTIDSTNKKREDEKTYTMKSDKAFAKFKSYNNSTNKAGISAKDDKTINCFLHLGGTRNWSPIIKKTKPNPINGFKTDMIPSNTKLSYLDYKKMKTSN
jgi:hypothetical protein